MFTVYVTVFEGNRGFWNKIGRIQNIEALNSVYHFEHNRLYQTVDEHIEFLNKVYPSYT